MPRIKVKFNGNGDPRKWVESKVSKIESANRESMTQAVTESSQLMKEHISNRGTAHSGKRGRIETAKMVGAVNSTVSERTQQKWSGAFGWLTERESYFLYQEDGFTHLGAGRKVEGMYAMRDAGDQVWDQLKAKLEANVRGA